MPLVMKLTSHSEEVASAPQAAAIKPTQRQAVVGQLAEPVNALAALAVQQLTRAKLAVVGSRAALTVLAAWADMVELAATQAEE